jgi:potassium-transporting ATPase potassium-binding subunit
VRGFARRHTGELGNFWVDLIRGVYRILLPVSVIAAIVLIAGGAIENFHLHDQVVTTLGGAQQTITGGPVASQEAIKEFGTNGGGFFNANSAHPFENPNAWTNWLEIFLLLLISFSLPRTFGRMVGSKKQGYAIAAVMAVLAFISVGFILWTQLQHHGTVPTSVSAAFEGIEQRFGVANSTVFGDAATLTSTGEVAPGGTGSGLYGILVLAVITVFVAGLMVGRTPEYLGKKINAREIKLASIYFLTTPLIVLVGAATAMALPGERAGMANSGPHGLSEVLYAFTSAANNNGSAFAGLTGNTVWYNTALGLAMALGRFLPMIFVLALAGSLARQGTTPQSVGTLPTHRPQFVGMVAGVTIILVALTFLPMLALGPLAEGIH